MAMINSSHYQYRTLNSTYLIKFKEDKFTLKIVDLSQKCLFKQTLPKHLKQAEIHQKMTQGGFETFLEQLAQESLLSREYLPTKTLKITEKECETVFEQALAKTKPLILVEHKDLERYSCPITLEVFQDPVIDDHGHTFERSAIEHYLKQKNTCPINRQSIASLSPNRLVKETLEEWKKRDPIPTLSHFQKDNPRLAENNLQMAEACVQEEEYQEALDFYQKAFQYTQNWIHYKGLPQLFEKMQEPEKAQLAILYLAYYQFKAGNYKEAIQTLESSRKHTPHTHQILIELYNLIGEQEKALELSIETARTLSSSHPEQAIQLYMRILRDHPTQLSLYSPLATLIDNPALKAHILLKGVLHALQLQDDLVAEELAHQAQSCSQNTFIDEQPILNLLQKQQNTPALKKHLQQLAQKLESAGKQHEALQAYKMLFQLENNPATSQKVVELYNQKHNTTKAHIWSLIHLNLLIQNQTWEQAEELAETLLQKGVPSEIILYEKLEHIYTHWQGHKLENLWHKLGRAYQDDKQITSAEKTYRKAYERFQGFTQAIDLAQILSEQGKIPESIELYYKASLQALLEQNLDQHTQVTHQIQKIDPKLTHLTEAQKTNLLMQSQIVTLQSSVLRLQIENQRLIEQQRQSHEKIESLEKVVQPLKEKAIKKEQQRQAELKRQEEKARQEELERARLAELEIKRREELSQMWFGKAKWETYFGDIGVEPPLPSNIHEILDAPCPIWPGKRVHETHLLTLIPQTINGQPLTLQKLGELVQKPLQGPATKYSSFNLGNYSDQPTPRSHWTLLSRDVIPNSRSKNYAAQQQVAAPYGGYEIPNVLDIAVTLFMEHVQSGTRLYEGMYTRCQEKYNASYQLAVGGFAAGGLRVNTCHDDENVRVGVGLSRKFL